MPLPIEKMNPNFFTYGMYCGTVGVSTFCLFHEGGYNTYPPILKPHWRVLGYCDANQLKCRPKNGFAVMIESDVEDVKCWFHLDKDEFKLMFTPKE